MTYQSYSGPESRKYERYHIAGEVNFKAYTGEKYEYYQSYYKDCYKDAYNYKDAYGKAEYMNKSEGGVGIKTSSPLEKGYILEIMNPDTKQTTPAMVRYSTQQNYSYYAGLQYLY